MLFMKLFVHQLFYLIDDNKEGLFKILSLSIILATIEIISLSSIIPYVKLVLGDPENLFQIKISNFSNNLGKKDIIIISSGLLLFVFLIKTFVAILIQKHIINFSSIQQLRIKPILMSGYQQQTYLEYVSKNSSSYVYNIVNLANQLTAAGLMPLLKLVTDFFILSVILIVLIIINYQIVILISLIMILFFVVFTTYFNPILKNCGVLINQSSKNIIKAVNEAFYGFKEIKILSKENFFLQSVIENSKIQFENYKLNQIILLLPKFLLEFLALFFLVIIIFYFMIINENIQEITPIITVFAFATLRLVPIVNNITHSYSQISYSKNSIDLLYRDVKKFDKINSLSKDQNKNLKQEFSYLEFKNINLDYYDSKNNILNDVSIKIEKGKTYGIFGPSGSGKTTLINTIIGLIRPNSGKIFFNGAEVQFEDLSKIQNNFAYLPQEVFIFDGSIYENITLEKYNKDLLNSEKLSSCLKISKTDEMIKSMKNGLFCKIGEKGVKISGGQKQKISLARALYHERDLIVIDEATSNIDLDSENIIIDDIKKLGTTNIIISHRVKSIANCDYVYCMENGRIIKEGSYDKVLGNQL